MFKFLLIIISYLIGSIPSGYLIGKIVKNIDIRKYGSKNIGFTNVLRVMGPLPGSATLLGDIGKGILAVYLIKWFVNDSQGNITALAGMSVIIGHIYPLFLNFKGGKGVATSLGVFLGIAPFLTGIVFLCWVIVVVLTHYVSLGSIVTAALLPFLMLIFRKPFPFVILAVLSGLLIIARHTTNIRRLVSGKENKIKLLILITFTFIIGGNLSGYTAPKFMYVEELTPGMKGIGKTVFSGVKPEEFQVEILGILKKIRPESDLILAKLSGGPLEKTGVIAGMSGSPVYIRGRLIGAVAYAWSFSKEPIAGITPIKEMLKIKEREEKGFLQKHISQISITEKLVKELSFLKNYKGTNLGFISTPLIFSGLHPCVIEEMKPVFNSFGLSLMQGGTTAISSSLEPGSAIGIQLVGGSANVDIVGTLTYIEGDKILAFGHPVLFSGAVDLPLTQAYVEALLPSQFLSSKFSSTTEILGSVKQDRLAGVSGRIGEKPALLPFKVKIRTQEGKVQKYKFQIVRDKFLTPFLIQMMTLNSLFISESARGDSTMKIHSEIYFKNYPPLLTDNIFSSSTTPTLLASSFSNSLSQLVNNSFKEIEIEKVLLEITVEKGLRTAQIIGARVNKNKVKLGDILALTIFLKPYQSELITNKIDITVPAYVSGEKINLYITDKQTNTQWEKKTHTFSNRQPKSFAQMLKLMKEEKKNNDVIITLTTHQPGIVIKGEDFLIPPSSFFAVAGSSEKEVGVISTTRESILWETTLPTQFIMQGKHTLTLNIDRSIP